MRKAIRVKTVARGPIWTPLIASTMPADKVASFGDNVPLGRAGQPVELAPSTFCWLPTRPVTYPVRAWPSPVAAPCSETACRLSHLRRMLVVPGGLEDDPPCDLYGMIGEPFVEAAQ